MKNKQLKRDFGIIFRLERQKILFNIPDEY